MHSVVHSNHTAGIHQAPVYQALLSGWGSILIRPTEILALVEFTFYQGQPSYDYICMLQNSGLVN